MARELERVRKVERRTQSELIREALRHYMKAATVREVRNRVKTLAEEEPGADEIDAIRAGREQFRTGQYVVTAHAVDRRAQQPRRKKP
jgi:Arc/MetJ-type ribon-helix-helix transcriptional regulator